MTQFLLVTDLDNTLVGDLDALKKLNDLLITQRQQYGAKIVYSTGRSLVSYQYLRRSQPLLQPDALITSVGTEIYDEQTREPDPVWAQQLQVGWDRDLVVATAAHFSDLMPQPESEQGRFKVSYYVTEEAAAAVIPQLESLLKARQVAAQLIYSGGQDLDILPEQADKGTAMVFLRQRLNFSPEQTVACGDSGNDLAFFRTGEERGIIVGNARPELLQWHNAHPSANRYLARAACAGGIMEGLQHFGFV